MEHITQVLYSNIDDEAKALTHLLAIVKMFGWETIRDKRIIKPNMRAAQLYIRRNKTRLSIIFKTSFDNVTRENVVDFINPFLIQMWRVQIEGTPDKSSLNIVKF